MIRPLCAGLVFLAISLGGAAAAPRPPADPAVAAVNWPAFLGRQDLVWTKVPAAWNDSPFIGNGNLGATIYTHGAGLGWEINRADVFHGQSRYPMGQISLQPAGGILGGSARLDLWNAEARGTLVTRRGEMHWRSFTATSPSVIAIEWDGGAGDLTAADLVWLPSLARPPRKVHSKGKEPLLPDDLHPPPQMAVSAGLVTSTQKFIQGGAFAVALLRDPATGGRRRYYASVGAGATEAEALSEATAAVQRAAAMGFDALAAAHRAWWHAYYPRSFVSVPDARLEAFYWIQMYKLGAAMRPDGPVLDLMGPWFNATPWPRIWWNLNAQLTYSPLFTANRLPLAESLFGSLDRHRALLIGNVAPALRGEAAAIGRTSDKTLVSPVDLPAADSDAGREAGNLPWVMYLYWEHYRYQMDDAILRDRVLPLLSRSMGYYLANLKKDAEGHYHLAPTFSPELATVPDANYDLALLRWGLQTLISSCEHLKLEDPHLPRWRDVLANLTPFPTDASGLMVGAGLPLTVSHRHYSHLLAIYPLHLITPDQPDDRKLIETSLHTWNSRDQKFRGFSYSGAASIYALLGEGEAALGRIHNLLDLVIHPNTFYTEAGPVIETPLSGATSLQDMLLQSWGGKLRVFPALPGSWANAAFGDLRGEGAFLVSAERSRGQTAWVRIQSLAGEPCRLVVPGWATAVVRATAKAHPASVAADGPDQFVVSLPKGGWVTLAPAADSPLPKLAPVAEAAGEANPYPNHYRPAPPVVTPPEKPRE